MLVVYRAQKKRNCKFALSEAICMILFGLNSLLDHKKTNDTL